MATEKTKIKKPKKDKRVRNNSKKTNCNVEFDNEFTKNKEAVGLLNTMIGLPPIENKELKKK
jgi:hypothetical protein